MVSFSQGKGHQNIKTKVQKNLMKSLFYKTHNDEELSSDTACNSIIWCQMPANEPQKELGVHSAMSSRSETKEWKSSELHSKTNSN